jgi:alcohol dehydrogenase class IV
LIYSFLPRAFRDGHDIKARGQMLIAACMSGIPLGNSLYGIIHAMGHPLGALFDIPHAICISVLIPYAMKFNLQKNAEKYRLVGEAMGLDFRGIDDADMCATKTIDEISRFIKSLELSTRLRDLGVPEEGIKDIAEASLRNGGAMFNRPSVFKKDTFVNILKDAW